MDHAILSFVWAPEGVEDSGSNGRNAGFTGKLAELTVLLLRTAWMGDSLDASVEFSKTLFQSWQVQDTNLASSQAEGKLQSLSLMHRECQVFSGTVHFLYCY